MKSIIQHSSSSQPLIEIEAPQTSPFSQNIISLTQQDYIKLKYDANYWKGLHKQQKQKNEELKRDLDLAEARIRDLKQRLYGKKSEKGASKRDKPGTSSQTGTPRPSWSAKR